MEKPAKVAVILDPMRARLHHFNQHNQEITALHEVLRASCEGLLQAIDQVGQPEADPIHLAEDFRNQSAYQDMQVFARDVANRLRALQLRGAAFELGILVSPDMAEIVTKALDPDLSQAVRFFCVAPVGYLSETANQGLLSDWLSPKVQQN